MIHKNESFKLPQDSLRQTNELQAIQIKRTGGFEEKKSKQTILDRVMGILINR